MKLRWVVIAIASVGVLGSVPAQARHKIPRHCVDRSVHFSWLGFWTNPRPQPNGCAPPVFAYGEYVGQDPDPNIRSQLEREPWTGYVPNTH